ncbi:hypothetical protein [Geminisphaera colitermitum]|uniref:hypothetical protein n=1 Tax=Geminisphaera colitermitum TaxID=1148786 RepID=UPI000158C615|nr:hypothetical protein [Geminisphaera colitermitum]
MPTFDAPERSGTTVNLPVAGATDIYAGNLTALNAAGFAVPASAAAGLRVIGRAEGDALNAAGANSDAFLNVKRGCFRYANSATAAITAAHIGNIAYVENSTTVRTAPGAAPGIPAGRIVAVDDDGVWIDTRHQSAATTITE